MNGILIPWIVATTLLLFLAAYWIYTLEKRIGQLTERYERLLNASEVLSESTDQAALLPLLNRLDDQERRLGRLEPQAVELSRVLAHAVQGLGIVRYNAFEGVGGDQSFSVALVDGSGNGAVLTGLHTGDDVRVYAKPLRNWKSSYSLSADEQRALGGARQVLNQGGQ
jgi:hypothetical protein